MICRRENRIQNINQTRDENLLVVVEELNEVVFTTEERYSLLFCFEIVFFDITALYIVVLSYILTALSNLFYRCITKPVIHYRWSGYFYRCNCIVTFYHSRQPISISHTCERTSVIFVTTFKLQSYILK